MIQKEWMLIWNPIKKLITAQQDAANKINYINQRGTKFLFAKSVNLSSLSLISSKGVSIPFEKSPTSLHSNHP